ncbi:hypothetical protein [Paenibacillus humicus]|uniref:hypothetical protein n=1 Tax=Paenibacillus humicus TaxID=412861 RepID=UPI003F16B6EE
MANITLTITAVDAGDLNSTLQDLASLTPSAGKPVPTPTAVGPAPVEEKPKRGRQAAAAPIKEEHAVPAESHEPEGLAEGSDGEEGTGDAVPTIEELRAKASAVSKSGKQDKVKALLESYGVAAVSKVPEEKRADFLAKLEAL